MLSVSFSTVNFSCVQISVMHSLLYEIVCNLLTSIHLSVLPYGSEREPNTEIRTQLKFAVQLYCWDPNSKGIIVPSAVL